MTNKPTPTDEELTTILCAHWPAFAAQSTLVKIWLRDAVQDAIDKWGQPAQAAEPVEWLRNTTDPQPHAVTNLKYRSAVDAKAGVEYIPVFAAPQPVAREPLTPDQVKAICVEARYETATLQERADFINGIRHAERHHGIKGDPHVE